MQETGIHCLTRSFYVKSNIYIEICESIERIKAIFEIEYKHLTT